MTVSRAERQRRAVFSEPETTPAGYLAAALEVVAATARTLTWPHPRYQKDPTAFAADIFGIELWGDERTGQVRIANAVVKHRKTSVCSGHRVGKSAVCAILALWFYCSFPKARVFITGPTLDQVEDVIWREIKILVQERAGTCVGCRKAAEAANPDHPEYPRPCPHSALIVQDGDVLHMNADEGLRSRDHREITGHTADRPEAMQGRASPAIFYIVDEASGVRDDTLRVVQSNLAAKNSRSIYISNPTRTEGIFYESQTSSKDQYHCIQVSSLDVVRLGIEGLADIEWVKETAALSGGTDSAEYQIRVLGKFVSEQTQKVIPRTLIDEAIERWSRTKAEGQLHLGVDVARFGDDLSAIAVRRGKKIIEVITKHLLDEHGVTDWVLETADRHRESRETVIIKVDEAGVGIPVVRELSKRASRFHQIIGLHPGSKARLEDQFAYLRDQLWFSAAQWLREEGALPDDDRLAAELHAPVYGYDPRMKRRVESKDNTKKQLKRSPDRADAVCLAVWDEAQFQAAPMAVARAAPGPPRPAGDAVYGPPRFGSGADGGDAVYGPPRRR